jgi:hypothetical protein
MTTEEAIQQLRKIRDDGSESLKLFYGALEKAHPSVVAYMENHAAEMFIASSHIKDQLKEHWKDPEKREEMKKRFEEMATTARARTGKIFDPSESTDED